MIGPGDGSAVVTVSGVPSPPHRAFAVSTRRHQEPELLLSDVDSGGGAGTEDGGVGTFPVPKAVVVIA
jgi:hypothetical protein